MPLTPGVRLGPYEIVSAIGAGGMGEVYRARDTQLKRDVALKVLPAAVAADPERLARFQREAELLAALNHPHIAHLYGLVDADLLIPRQGSEPARSGAGAVRALVMELVDGVTLAERIARGAVPVAEALPIARQLAEALEYAHEHGIIHRDLKPANINVTSEGAVKVLDFGLAKALAPDLATAAHDLEGANSPTVMTPAMTQAGIILGTAAYMSPEQARGKAVDKRADIWAFGVVLLEMLTGRAAFPGETITDVLGAIMHKDPDWSGLPADTPPLVRRLLARCLTKDAKQRLHDIADARLEIEESTSRPAETSAVPPGRQGPTWLWMVATLVMSVAAAAVAVIYIRMVSVEPPETRLEITTAPGRLSYFDLSPDGRKVVFAASPEGRPSQLWLRSFESENAQPLPGTEGASFPFWAPDSRSIGFFSAGELKRIDIAGGIARSLAKGPNALGGAWNPNGTIVFTPTATSPLYSVPASGGSPVEVTHFSSPAEGSHRLPDFLPDGRHFVFFVAGTTNLQGVYLGSLDSKETRRLLESDSAAVFAPPDYVLFRRQDNLLGQRLNLETLEILGDAFSVAERVSGDRGMLGEIAVSTSHTGVIAYRAPVSARHQLTWFDRMGRPTGTVADVREDEPAVPVIRLSPDGRTVAVTRRVSGHDDVWLIDTARGVQRRFTSDPAADGAPVWSPDSNRLVFYSRRRGPQNLWLKPIGGGVEERLRESAANEFPTDWSPDGRFVLLTTGSTDVWALPLEAHGKPIAVASTSFVETQGRFSPDSHWVAYVSNETGRNETYVVPFPGPGAPTPVSIGTNPQWRQDGREIFSLGPDDRLMAVPVTVQGNGRLETGTSTPLFMIPHGATYDVTRDGQRILIDSPVAQAATPPITVILNWKPPRK